jgi:hypothetical protein
MSANNMEFLNAPEQNLRTWNKIWKTMLISAAVTLAVIGLLGLIFI